MLYQIRLIGCDDRTVVTMELSPEHFSVLNDLKRLVNEESYYDCMPTMDIKIAQDVEDAGT